MTKMGTLMRMTILKKTSDTLRWNKSWRKKSLARKRRLIISLSLTPHSRSAGISSSPCKLKSLFLLIMLFCVQNFVGSFNYDSLVFGFRLLQRNWKPHLWYICRFNLCDRHHYYFQYGILKSKFWFGQRPLSHCESLFEDMVLHRFNLCDPRQPDYPKHRLHQQYPSFSSIQQNLQVDQTSQSGPNFETDQRKK